MGDFKGGTTNVFARKTLSAVHSLPSISISGNGIISIMSSDKIISAGSPDLLGRTFFTVRAEWRSRDARCKFVYTWDFTLFGADGRRIGDAIDKTIELRLINK